VSLKTWLLTLEEHSISLEDFELVHLGLSHLDNGVIVLLGVLTGELVGGLLLVENGSGKVFLLVGDSGGGNVGVGSKHGNQVRLCEDIVLTRPS